MGVMDQQERMEDSFLFFLCNYCLGEPLFLYQKHITVSRKMQ